MGAMSETCGEDSAMTIHYQCACGAEIALPELAAGRRARCRSCGAVFRVPQPMGPDLSGWADAEREFDPGPMRRRPDAARAVDGTPSASPVRYQPALAVPPGMERRGGVTRFNAPPPSFWEDLAWSFVFFLRGSNLASFAMIVLVGLVLAGLSFVPIAWMITWGLGPMFAGWVVAFFLHIVVETADGEDEWSPMSTADIWDDLIKPAFQFTACCLIAFGPALVVSSYVRAGQSDVSPYGLLGLAALGAFVWPILVLATAIGHQLPLAYLPTLVRAVFVAPASYLAICLSVIAAGGLGVLLAKGPVGLLASQFGPNPPIALAVAVVAFMHIAEVYAIMVCMRLIGLYYRHFKDELPF